MSKKKFNLELKYKINPFKKSINVDSDKSISIRSFLIGSISENISTVKNVLESEDVLSTIKCLKKLGVVIKKKKSKYYQIYGKGLGSLAIKKNSTLNFGNSGTLARLLIGILSTTPNIEVNLLGDHSLNKRNMKKLIDIMSEYGTFFLPKKKYNFPLKMISSQMPIGIKYDAGESAQLKSAVIFAGLNSFGETVIQEKIKSRDHTENMLRNNKKVINIKKKKFKTIKILGKKYLEPIHVNVPGDPSSAAFFTALTLLNRNSILKIKNVGLNPTRIGFYEILKKQKAKIQFTNIKKDNNDIRGDIVVQSSKLKPIITPANYYSKTTDEYLILFIMASLIKGVSIFKNISGLSNKESSRALEMKKILEQFGVKCKLNKNEMRVFGKGNFDASNKKIVVPNLGDHRICQSTFILASLTGAKTKINNFETVFTSAPSFLKIVKSLGAKFNVQI